MSIIQSFPLFNIVMCLMCGVLSSVLSGRLAKRLSLVLVGVAGVMNAFVLRFVTEHGQYTYPMGHFPAPFGNEIRVGSLEALLAVFFCAIMFLSVLGGEHYIDLEVEETKENLYFTMVNLMLASLLALIYTNDMFTAYVFVEINTIAAGAMIMSRNTGHTLVAATKYMIMSLVGSGFLLLGLSMLYSVTGHLLMVDMHGQIVKLSESGQYAMPLTVSMALMSVGLAVKSALFPFHTWLADAYSYSTPASAAVLSSLVSKGYIFLLIKIFYRVLGYDNLVCIRCGGYDYRVGGGDLPARCAAADRFFLGGTDWLYLYGDRSCSPDGDGGGSLPYYVARGIKIHAFYCGQGTFGCVGRQQGFCGFKGGGLAQQACRFGILCRGVLHGGYPAVCGIYFEGLLCGGGAYGQWGKTCRRDGGTCCKHHFKCCLFYPRPDYYLHAKGRGGNKEGDCGLPSPGQHGGGTALFYPA